MRREKLLTLMLLLCSIPVSAINLRFTLGANPDGAYSTAFTCMASDRSDCAPPTVATLAWSTIANQSVLTGSSYSVNLRSLYLTGSNAASATLSIVNCSLPTGWSATTDGLSYTGTGAGSASCKAQAVASGQTTVSNIFTVASSAPAVSDTNAPTQGLIESIALNGSNKPVLSIFPGCDPEVSGSSGLASYKVYRDGVALSPTSVTSPIQSAYTSTDIGTLSPAGTSTQSNGYDWLDTAEGQVSSGTGNDEFRFSYRTLNGAFIASAKIESFANVVSTLARASLIARESTGAQDAFVTAQALANSSTRMQYRATASGTRTSTGVGAITFPYWIQLERGSDLTTWTLRQSPDGVTWTTVTTLTQSMPTSLLVGRATASQSDGNAVSAQFRQLCVTTLGRQTYTDSAASSGATHSYTVSWIDANSNEGTQSASVSIAVPAAPPTVQIKWHPGHYKFNQNHQTANNTVSTTIYTDMANEPSAIKGMMQPYYWAALEPTSAGVYDWSTIDSKLSLLKSMGKRMIIYVRSRSCCASSVGDTNYLPTYIINGASYGTVGYSYGKTAKIWEQATMDRLIALYQAIGDRYDSEPAFEGVATDETAIGFGAAGVPSNCGADCRDELQAQYDRLIRAWNSHAPHTQLWFYGNWMSPEATRLKALYTSASATKVGGGGPDLAELHAIPGDAVLRGDASYGGHDFRGEIAINYIGMAYLPNVEGQTAQQSYDYAMTMDTNYIAWKVHTDGTSGQNWTTGVIPVIQAHPATTTTCPSSFGASGCDTSN